MQTVTVTVNTLFQNATPFEGFVRVKLGIPLVEVDSTFIAQLNPQEIDFGGGNPKVSFIAIPNSVLGEGTYYVVEIYRDTLVGAHHEYDCIYTGNIVIPDHDCNLADIAVIEPIVPDGGSIVRVDPYLDAESENPVQNRAVFAALEGKQDKGDYATSADLEGKQDKLVSGTTLKTVNGRSLLGSGNLELSGGGGASATVLVELGGDEICDYYAINSAGNAVSADGYGCTSFIPCAGCAEMHITNMQLKTAKSYGLAFYDENKTFLSFVKSLTGSEVAGVWQEVAVPEGAHYFKASFFDYETQKTVGKWRCTMLFDNTDTYTATGKRPYQEGFIWFSQGVNQSITRYWETAEAVQNAGEYKATTGVVALPKNYSPTGKPVPLILYAHGLSHYVYYDHWGANDTFIPQKQHWLDMGFAVMGCNGARNKKGGQFPTGICPQGVNAYKQCVDYVLRNYNVDPQIFIVAGSAGGALGWNYLNTYGNTVKAAVFISAWADLEYNAWTNGGAKSLFTEFLGFENTSTYEADKTIGFDQKQRIITIGSKDYCFMPYNVPIYGLYGGTETSLVTPMKNTFAALRNAGANARIRGIEGCGHEIVSGANIVVDTEIGNWLLSHYGEGGGKGIVMEKHTITYRYLDENDVSIKADATEEVYAGTVKDFSSAPAISGYDFVSVSPTSATVNEDLTVTYSYKTVKMYTITYKYVDASGSSVQTDTTEQVREGTEKTFTPAPEIVGYAAVSATPESATVNADMTVTYVYKSVAVRTITYRYVDTSGAEVQASTTEQTSDGTAKDFTVIVPSIDGYTFQSVTPESVTISADITVTYVYKALAVYTITYEYVTADGTTVQASTTESVTEGTEKVFTGTAPSVTGYAFESVTPQSVTVSADLTVTYLYREVNANDLTSLFSWNRTGWMAVSNPQWKSSSNFMSCFTDLSAYVGKTIEITVPQYTASNGTSSTGMTAWHTQPTESASSLYQKAKIWDVDTNGNGKGVLVPIQLVVPAEAPYLWTSTYMDGVAAYVGPNSGREDFYCRVVE